MRSLFRLGSAAHGFGFKQGGLANAGRLMESADSMTWSYAARFRPVRLSGCAHAYPACECCPASALPWRHLPRLLGMAL